MTSLPFKGLTNISEPRHNCEAHCQTTSIYTLAWMMQHYCVHYYETVCLSSTVIPYINAPGASSYSSVSKSADRDRQFCFLLKSISNFHNSPIHIQPKNHKATIMKLRSSDVSNASRQHNAAQIFTNRVTHRCWISAEKPTVCIACFKRPNSKLSLSLSTSSRW